MFGIFDTKQTTELTNEEYQEIIKVTGLKNGLADIH